MVAPSGIVSTAWPKVRDTCMRLGWGFDGWQAGAGRLILAKRSDGGYAADTVVISIPRQVGKTYLIACIIYALCLTEPGLTVIWTAHRKTTSAETFRQFDGMSQRPKVAPHIRQVLRGKGDEKILFNNGSRILFGARESGFGRGMTDVDVLVLDEGQILPESTLEDMGATQNVATNPLTFVMGTPPRPKDDGEFFTTLRREAIDGESDGTLYIETSADRGCDPMDRDQWRKANPSFPLRTTERAMLRLRKKLKSDDSWNREALGIHDEVLLRRAVSAQAWRGLQEPGPDDGVRPTALAADMSHAGELSIVACWVDWVDVDAAHLEEVWAGVDVQAATEWLIARAGRRIPVLLADGGAAALLPDLRAKRAKVQQATVGDMARGCGLLVSKAKAKRLTHAGQQSLDDALAAARLVPVGKNGARAWDRTDEKKNVAPIGAATLALYAARSAKSGRRSGGAVFA